MSEEYVSRLMANIQELDIELAKESGLDIAIMKSILDYRVKFRIASRDWMDTAFITLNSKCFMKFNIIELISFIPLWKKEQAINVFNSLVSSELIRVDGDISSGDVLILIDLKTG